MGKSKTKDSLSDMKRQRKIAHVRKLRSEGKAKGEVRDKALQFMKMDSEDLQEAFDGHIY